ncbi:A-kinase anchor protein 13, partial [Eschrichtius robustus]|nr:A-kinase anchor protein 13 [Eschrichtius robustus]
MDSLMPSVVTAQEPSSLPSDQDTDGQFLPCASAPTASQQLASPEGAESSQCCHGSTVGQIESSYDLSSVVKEENTDSSHRKKNTGVERKGDEEEPAPIVDSGTASDPDSCRQSTPDCTGKDTEGLPSCGVRSEETGTKSSAMATGQESPGSGGRVLQGGVALEPGTAQSFSGGELVVPSPAGASVPDTAGETEHSLVNPEATIQRNVLAAGESMKERFEDSNISTAGASDVKATDEPVDKASVPNGVSAAGSLVADKPAESLLVVSDEETAIDENTAETETSGSCEESADAPGAQNSQLILAAAKDEISEGLELDTPWASMCVAVSPPDLTFPRPQKDVMPNQKSEADSSRVQSQSSKSPICSTTGDDKLCAASACRQNMGTSSGVLAVEHCDDIVTQPEGTPTGLLNTQPLPTASCSEGPQANTVTPDPVRDTQEHVDFCPLQVLDEESQGKDSKLETSLADMLEVVPHPHALVPKAEKERVSDQAVTSGRTSSLTGSPGSESVTKDDALSLVPSSQNEKGTATLEPPTDCRDGPDGDSNDLEKQPPEDSAVGLCPPSSALDLQPGMGNTSPVGPGGECERPCLSAAPEVLNIVEGATDSSLLHVGQATLASDSALTEEGKDQVVPESPTAQGPEDKDKAVTCSSIKDSTLRSGTLQEEPRTPPPGQEAPGFCEEPGPAACDEDRAPRNGNSLGTPWACLHAATKHNKEVAPPVAPLVEGGAAQSLVPPGASLAADSSQEASGTEQSSSRPLPNLLPGGFEVLTCERSSALDVEVKNTQSQGKTTACEVSGNAALGGAVVSALQGTTGARRKDTPHDAPDTQILQVSSSQEKNMILGLPGPLPDKGVTDPQGAAPPEVVSLGWEKGKVGGADGSRSTGDSKETQVDEEAHHVPPQPAAKEHPTETGLSSRGDKAPGRGRDGAPLPCTVAAKAVLLPETADLIEEAASRIVDAVIERVKASGELTTEGEVSHMSLPCPSESGPGPEQLESASAGKASAFQPAETPPMGSSRGEASGNLAGCFAGREEPEKIILPLQGPTPATGQTLCLLILVKQLQQADCSHSTSPFRLWLTMSRESKEKPLVFCGKKRSE